MGPHGTVSPTTDVPEWLGIEVLSRSEDHVMRLRNPKGDWAQRPATPQELQLYEALVAVLKLLPNPTREVLLDSAELRTLLSIPEYVVIDPDKVISYLRMVRGENQRLRTKHNVDP
jgi:hypothetical protein